MLALDSWKSSQIHIVSLIRIGCNGKYRGTNSAANNGQCSHATGMKNNRRDNGDNNFATQSLSLSISQRRRDDYDIVCSLEFNFA